MTRTAAVLAAALAASGCIITDNGTDPTPYTGSVNLYWDFLRYAPDAGATWSPDANGFIVYDGDLVGSGNSACPESGVQSVDVSSPNGTLNFPCTFSGVQGVTLDGLPEGNVTLRVKGWRNDGGDRVLWDGTVQVNVLAGHTVDAYIDVAPMAADLDVVGYFTNLATTPDTTYTTCNAALNPEVDYKVWDSLGTLVIQGTALCPAGASAVALPIIVDTLDLDTYTIRAQGYTTFVDPVFDSCTAANAKYLTFDHYAARVSPNPLELDLYSPPVCTPAP